MSKKIGRSIFDDMDEDVGGPFGVDVGSLVSRLQSELNADGEYPREESVKILREFCASDYKKTRFNVGDIVTPRRDSNIKWPGRPCVVVEFIENPDRDQGSAVDSSSSAFGCYHNIRVATVCPKSKMNGGGYTITLYWDESHAYEIYDPAVHGANKAASPEVQKGFATHPGSSN